MPCGTCGQKTFQAQQLNPRQVWQATIPAFDPDCPYNVDVLEVWRTKLLCIKEQSLLEQVGIDLIQLHNHLGMVISAINYSTQPCRYREHLEKIEPVIFKLAELNLC